jgi:hypothetical protein
MFDLRLTSPLFNAKFGAAVTIMVLTSACAHEIFITPSNSSQASYEESTETPEPLTPAEVSSLTESKTSPPAKARKHVLAKRAHQAHKTARVAAHKARARKTKIAKASAAIAAVEKMPTAPTQPQVNIPAPEIAPPTLPSPLASAGVQTEIDSDSGTHWGLFAVYALGALALAGLIYVAPRARRAKPKRKLVYNG